MAEEEIAQNEEDRVEEGGVAPAVSSADDDYRDDPKPTRSRRRLLSLACTVLVSLVLFALFAYSANVQYNDPDMLSWAIFYSLHAALALLFVLQTCLSKRAVVGKLMYFLSFGMAIWSIVYVALVSKELGGGGVVDDDLREELVLELAGACIGLISAGYHVLATRCCVGKDGKCEEE